MFTTKQIKVLPKGSALCGFPDEGNMATGPAAGPCGIWENRSKVANESFHSLMLPPPCLRKQWRSRANQPSQKPDHLRHAAASNRSEQLSLALISLHWGLCSAWLGPALPPLSPFSFCLRQCFGFTIVQMLCIVHIKAKLAWK